MRAIFRVRSLATLGKGEQEYKSVSHFIFFHVCIILYSKQHKRAK